MSELKGFIKLHRKLVDWGWYQDSAVKDTFLHLILTACFHDTDWLGTTIKRGELVTSVRRLSEELGFSPQQIRTALSKLESTNEITIKSTNKYTVINVVNWEKYQCYDELSNKQNNKQITNDQQTKIMPKSKISQNGKKWQQTNQQTESVTESSLYQEFANSDKNLTTSTLTNEQQTNNKQITNKQQHIKNNKNVKNDKNIKKEINKEKSFVSPAPLMGEAHKLSEDAKERLRKYGIDEDVLNSTPDAFALEVMNEHQFDYEEYLKWRYQ